MDEMSDGALSSAQLMFLHDQLEYPANGWTTVRSTITIGSHLSESEVRNLLTFICNKYDAVHSRVVRDEHGLPRQLVTGLEYFFGECFRYTTSPDEDCVGEMEWKQIDVLTCSSVFVAVAEPDRTTLHHLGHHSFFDRTAVNILLTEIILASRDPEITSGRASSVQPSARSLQPWQVRRLELLPHGARATRRWQEFHSVRRAVPWQPVHAGGPTMTNLCMFGMGPGFARACEDAAKRWSISTTAAVNSAVCAHIAIEFGAPDITVKSICSNRLRREFNGAVASVSGEVWTAYGTERVGEPDWCRSFAAEQLTAYRYGLYDWDAVRTSPNFRSPYRSDQTVMINTFVDPGPQTPAEPDQRMRDVLLLSPISVPYPLTHDLQFHISLSSSDVTFSLAAGHDYFDDPTLVEFSRGLKKFLTRHFG